LQQNSKYNHPTAREIITVQTTAETKQQERQITSKQVQQEEVSKRATGH